MVKFIVIFLFCFICNLFSEGNDFRTEDKIRIREAYKIAERYGNKVWQGWDKAPFTLLLITNENEYLINHQNPSEDFKLVGYDSIVSSNVYTRPRQFPNNFLATFPAVNGVSTIVVGQAENTSRPTVSWVITILHEHFHQLQNSYPDYQPGVNALDLSGGDQTGMWMLNYPFPYKDENIAKQYKILTLSARDAAFSDLTKDSEKFKIYIAEREKLKSMLSEKDYRYFSFQIWQEGIARYTEVKLGEMLKGNYTPTIEVTALSDYRSIDSFYTDITNKLSKRAETQDLTGNQRDCFYTLGAFEGMILDKVNPNWKNSYFTNKFHIEEYYSK